MLQVSLSDVKERAELLILHVSRLQKQQQCDLLSVCTVGFHVRSGPDEKEKLRRALFPKVPTVSDLSSFM